MPLTLLAPAPVAMALFYEAAAWYDDPASAEHLDELLAHSDDLGRSDRDGMTLLHYACKEGHLEAVIKLVRNGGVALEAQDRNARTPLHLACLMARPENRKNCRGAAHVEIAEFLQTEGACTSTQDVYGYTPLAYLPPHAKRVGRNVPSVDGRAATWVVQEVHRGGAVLNGSVASVCDAIY